MRQTRDVCERTQNGEALRLTSAIGRPLRAAGAPDRAQGGLSSLVAAHRARVPGDSGTRVLTAVVKNNRVQRLKPNSLETHN